MEKRSVLYGLLSFGGLLLLSFVFIFVLLRTTGHEHSGWSDDDKDDKGPHIGVLELTGVIMESLPTIKRLHTLRTDKEIDAILIRIDSPGGAVAPSQEIAAAVKRARKDKRVICSMGTVAASGGYYVASQCDRIFASPGTITASIGVITQMPKLHNVLSLLRVEMETYTSGALKDAGSPFRATTDEERAFFKHFVQSIYEQFVADVADGRKNKITLEQLRPIADGRILTGKEAMEAGLIDELGNFELALDRAAELSGKPGKAVPVFPPEKGGKLLERFFGRAASEVGHGLLEGLRDEGRQRVEARDPRL